MNPSFSTEINFPEIFPAQIFTLESSNETVNFSLSNTNFTFPLAKLLSENWWNIFDERYLRHSWEWTITLIIAYMLILIIGVLGNCMVILVVLLRPQMRSVINMFIMNLAVADLFVIVFCVIPTLLANVLQPWILGSFMCKAMAYVQGISVCASAYSLVTISLDRCYAVYRPIHRFRGLSKSQALKIISLIWIAAMLLTLPWAIIFDVVISETDGLTCCIETWENEYHGKIYFLIANLIFCYGFPLFLISISNEIISCQVARRKVPQESASTITIKRMHRKTGEGVRKMLGVVTFTFLICWLPLYVLLTRLKFGENISETELNVLDILMAFAQWLGSFNSCFNPVLYAFLNNKFRKMFQSLLPKWIPFNYDGNLTSIGMWNNAVTGSNGTFSNSAHCTSTRSRRSSGRSRPNSSRRQHSNRHTHRTSLVSNLRSDNGVVDTIIASRVPVATSFSRHTEIDSATDRRGTSMTVTSL